MFARLSAHAPTQLLVAIALLHGGCSGSPSVNDLFVFDATKAVQLQVEVNLAAGAGGQAVDGSQAGRYFLRAVAADGSGVAVRLAPVGQAPVDPLPVILAGPRLSFAAVAAVPAEMQAGADGYALHFQLSQDASAARTSPVSSRPPTLTTRDALITDGSKLEALLGGVARGTRPEANLVSLSLASTLAVQLLGEQGATLSLAASLQSYAKIAALFTERQKSIEADVAPGAKVAPATFISAMMSALQKEAATDVVLQTNLAAVSTAVGSAAAQGFISALSFWTQAASAVLAKVSTALTQVFTPGYQAAAVQAINIVKQAPVPSFAPQKLTFVDTDPAATIGGEVVVVAGKVAVGVTGYAIYLGGEAPDTARLAPLGVAAVGDGQVRLGVPAGTAVPAGATRLWAFPVVAGAELSTALSIPLGNAIKPPAAPGDVLALGGDGIMTVTWTATQGATSTTLLRGTQLPLSPANCTPVPDATSPYVDHGLTNGTRYYYALASQRGTQTGPFSSPVAATPESPLPPPEGLGRNPGDGEVTVSWEPNPQATRYRLYRTTQQPAKVEGAQILDDVLSPYLDTGLTNNTTYYYAIEYMHGDTPGGTNYFGPAMPFKGNAGLPPVVWMTNDKHPVCAWSAVPDAASYRMFFDGPGVATLNSPHFDTPGLSMPLDSQSGISTCAVQVLDATGNPAGPLSLPARIDLDMLTLADGALPAHVIGQPVFNNVNYTPGGAVMQGPALGIAATWAGALFLTDRASIRVMGFNDIPSTDGATPSLVVGQDQMADVAVLSGSGANTLNWPGAIAADDSWLWLVDQLDDGTAGRVVGYSPQPGASRPQASVVLGVPAFNWPSRPAQATQRTFLGAAGIAAASGRLAICDAKANRVLLYNRRPEYNNTTADIVLGQGDFTSSAAPTQVTAASLKNPTSAWTDGVHLLVYDAGHNRVLHWQTWPTSNHQPADFVFGQPDLTSGSANAGGAVSGSGLDSGEVPDQQPGVFSNGMRVAIADPGNQRVLILPDLFTSNGTAAMTVLGQPNFTTNTASPPRRDKMLAPQPVYIDSRFVIVGDVGNQRYLLFDAQPPP